MSTPSPLGNSNEKSLFFTALDIAGQEDRARFLAEACGSNVELLARLTHLLQISEAEEDLLDPGQYESLTEERDALVLDLAQEGRLLSELGSSIRYLGEDYELLEELGRGAVGVVFRARQLSLKREVAVKVILGSALASPLDSKRFQVEVEAAADLKHPNIVPVYEVGRHAHYDYYSMPLIRGGTLRHHLERHRSSRKESVQLVVTIARAVEAAHQLGVIHRDLKPDNILLDEHGRPHITDFGLASRLEQKSTLTLSGQIMGTPQYMAPEQVDSELGQVTTAADIYSLGSILYELLVGVPPLRGESILETLQMVRATLPRSPRKHDSAVDQDLATVVLKCLEKNPMHRYHSASALADDLEAWLAHRPIKARRHSTVERFVSWSRRRPVHACLLATALLLLLTLGVGGPLVAIKQSNLRREADEARQLAERESASAIESQALAEQAAKRNQSLAYAYSTRLAAAVAHTKRFSLASHAILRSWLPTSDSQNDPRGWEWYYSFADVFLAPLQISAASSVEALSFSPDGQLLVVSHRGSKGSVIRDGLNSAVVRPLHDPTGSHHQVFWNSSGDRILTLSSSGVAKIWNPSSGEELVRIPSTSPLVSISWNSPATRLLGLTENNSVHSWSITDLHDINNVTSVTPTVDGLEKIALSPDGRYVAAIANGTRAFVWATDELDHEPTTLHGHQGQITDLAWHRDSRWLATCSRDTTARIWELPAGSRLVRLHDENADNGEVTAIAWDANGLRLLYSYANKNELVLFDGPTSIEKVVGKFPKPISAISWSAMTHSIAIALEGGQNELRRIGLPPASRILAQGDYPLHAAAWSADGELVSALSADGELVIVTANGESRRSRFATPDGRIRLQHWDSRPHHNLAVVLDRNSGSELHYVNPPPRSPIQQLTLPNTMLQSIDWSSDRKHLAVLSRSGEVALWNPNTGLKVKTLKSAEASTTDLHQVSFCPDGLQLVATGDAKRIFVWQVRGDRSHSISVSTSSPTPVTHAWHPDGLLLATGNHDGSITIWDCKSGAMLRNFATPSAVAPHLAWHPSGSRLASGGDDKSIHIWNWEFGESPLSLPAHTKPIRSLAWSPDGIRLVSTSSDGTLRIWDATAGYLMSAASEGKPSASSIE